MPWCHFDERADGCVRACAGLPVVMRVRTLMKRSMGGKWPNNNLQVIVAQERRTLCDEIVAESAERPMKSLGNTLMNAEVSGHQ